MYFFSLHHIHVQSVTHMTWLCMLAHPYIEYYYLIAVMWMWWRWWWDDDDCVGSSRIDWERIEEKSIPIIHFQSQSKHELKSSSFLLITYFSMLMRMLFVNISNRAFRIFIPWKSIFHTILERVNWFQFTLTSNHRFLGN